MTLAFATITVIIIATDSHLAAQLANTPMNSVLPFLKDSPLIHQLPWLLLTTTVLAAIACVIMVAALSTTDPHHPVLHHYSGPTHTGAHLANRPMPAAQTLEAAHRQIENRLAHLNEALEQQRQMNALLSHEMRTPLATISTAIQSLTLMLEGSDAQIDNRLQRISRALTRITKLMEQLLVQDGTYDQAMAPQRERVDLAQLATEVVSTMQNDVAHHLQVDAPAPALAWCDGPLTGVILSNLIHNAAKYSPADQAILIQVGTLAAASEHTAWITVTDHGPGIEAENHERIFDPHFRRTAHRETKGLGLGLYLVRKICERQGGTLTVDSVPGQGARFTITIPTEKGRSLPVA
jgi:signal transduction histidine kinase